MAALQERDEEGDRGDPHERVDVRGLAVEDLDDDVADEAEADTLADVVGQRDADDRQERREGLFEVVPGDLANRPHHQEADDDECAGRDRETK